MRAEEALVIVDLQCAFSPPPRLVARIRRYAARFKLRVFTRFENPPGSQFRRVLKMHVCPPGAPENALLIEPAKSDVVLVKPSYGLSARQVARLKRLGIRKATVCGVETDACVLAVMFSLFDAGITCRVRSDLCWSSTGLHRSGLKVLAMQFEPTKGR
jgi:nicotinamidase-related amidase